MLVLYIYYKLLHIENSYYKLHTTYLINYIFIWFIFLSVSTWLARICVRGGPCVGVLACCDCGLLLHLSGGKSPTQLSNFSPILATSHTPQGLPPAPQAPPAYPPADVQQGAYIFLAWYVFFRCRFLPRLLLLLLLLQFRWIWFWCSGTPAGGIRSSPTTGTGALVIVAKAAKRRRWNCGNCNNKMAPGVLPVLRSSSRRNVFRSSAGELSQRGFGKYFQLDLFWLCSSPPPLFSVLSSPFSLPQLPAKFI